MKRKIIMTVLALMLVVGMAMSAYAHPGKWFSENLQNSLESEDYESFVSELEATGQDKRAEKMTEERFDRLVERYQKHSERRAIMEEAHEALEAEDYDAWVAALNSLEDSPKIFDVVTEENFDVFVDLHEARANGDRELVKELAEELGLERHKKGKMGGQKGWHK